MLTAPKKMYAAVRQDQTDGHEWIDLHTASSYKALAEDKADEGDIDSTGDISKWARANPVVRIGTFWMTETVEEQGS